VIEVLQVRLGRVFRLPIVDAQQIHVHLQGRVGEHPHQLDLGFYLLGHQVEDEHPQRADVLGDGPDSVITKMFSCPSTSAAGNWSGILIGMLTPVLHR
jgi:hypothetical protein